MKKHFTAVLEVKEVSEDSGTGRGDDKRFVNEVARIVVRADTLEGLRTKLAAHVALIEN